MPMPMPAITQVGRLSMRAMTAAARPYSSTDGPMLEPTVRPLTGARRNTAIADITAPMTHTTVDTRLIGIPSSEARSPFSADARMAMPMSLNLKNAPSAMQMVTTTMGMTMKL